MVQKECNCKTCSGVLPELDQENTIEKAEKETRSIYDQLSQIVYDYPDLTVRDIVIKVDEITSQIDRLDDDIRAIQKEALINPKEYTQFLLGKLSQKLY